MGATRETSLGTQLPIFLVVNYNFLEVLPYGYFVRFKYPNTIQARPLDVQLVVSATRPPPCRSILPASWSSSRTVRTKAGGAPDNRTRSSIEIGTGPSSPMIYTRS